MPYMRTARPLDLERRIIRRAELTLCREEEKIDPLISLEQWEAEGRLQQTGAFKELIVKSEHMMRLWTREMHFRILENVVPASAHDFFWAQRNAMPSRLNVFTTFLAHALADEEEGLLTAPVLLYSLTPSLMLSVQRNEADDRIIHAAHPSAQLLPVGTQLVCQVAKGA